MRDGKEIGRRLTGPVRVPARAPNLAPIDESDRHLLHRLWTLAVHTDGYHKADWIELERRFLRSRP